MTKAQQLSCYHVINFVASILYDAHLANEIQNQSMPQIF